MSEQRPDRMLVQRATESLRRAGPINLDLPGADAEEIAYARSQAAEWQLDSVIGATCLLCKRGSRKRVLGCIDTECKYHEFKEDGYGHD